MTERERRAVAPRVVVAIVLTGIVATVLIGPAFATPTPGSPTTVTKPGKASSSKTSKKASPGRPGTNSARAAVTPAVLRPEPLADPLDLEGVLLASRLTRLWTRDSDRLVSVIRQAWKETPSTFPVTFLLAIAHAETNGKVLIVSEAGAVGLAQATPIAYLAEGLEGRLHVTDDYIEGAKAYYLKKPLHDADVIATLAIDGGHSIRRAAASTLLSSAYKYCSEGVVELELLAPFGPPDFIASVRSLDNSNYSTLQRLEALLERGSDLELASFRDEVRARYRELRGIQRDRWKQYQRDVLRERDSILRERFGVEPSLVLTTLPYEAGEILAEVLDDRFSPRRMSKFLAVHIETKLAEARELGTAERDLEQVTAALYNGGGHNVKRIHAGLISGLAETDNYMRKVPGTRMLLDLALEQTLYEEPPTAPAGETSSR
ncbi:MAG TPA: hypothetical protein VMT00_02665 [Thermoanaerobaculia bacterium]|nr:hypothetical protein [Thermoanaerobaculia bacterium]